MLHIIILFIQVINCLLYNVQHNSSKYLITFTFHGVQSYDHGPGEQNYRGFFNLGLIIMVLSHFRYLLFMLCYVMYVMLCYVILCHVMSRPVALHPFFFNQPHVESYRITQLLIIIRHNLSRHNMTRHSPHVP
jgi:hypothetical protein